MGVVIDTGVFIRWERDGGIIDFSRWSAWGAPCISVITESELKVGIHRANTDERRARRHLFVSAVLSIVVVLPIDSKVADIHAGIFAALTQNRTTIGPHDNWIAATALRYDCELLSTNMSEFRRVPNLRVIEYPTGTRR
jgi:predicted nucleic acid-binding protein